MSLLRPCCLQMLLAQQFTGILDPGAGARRRDEHVPDPTTLETGLEAIEQVGNVVDSLYLRAAKLS